jgi:hypothetical protein
MLHYVAAAFALPIIPLYILAFRLLGKECTYHWPATDVRPTESISENQYLFIRAFPMLVFLAAFVIVGLALGQPIL